MTDAISKEQQAARIAELERTKKAYLAYYRHEFVPRTDIRGHCAMCPFGEADSMHAAALASPGDAEKGDESHE